MLHESLFNALKNEFNPVDSGAVPVNTTAEILYLLQSQGMKVAWSRSPKDSYFHALLPGSASQARPCTMPDLLSALRAFTSSLEQSSPHTPDSKHTVPLSMWALMRKSLRSTAPGSPRDSREVPQDPVAWRGVAWGGMAGTQGPDSPGPPLPNSNTASLLLHCFAQ